GQGLRPDHPGSPRPAEQAEYQDRRGLALGLEVAEQDDEQRQRGDDQDDVGGQGQYLVPDTAEDGGGGTDDHREHRGHQADDERELEGEPDPDQKLGQDVLTALRRAEQVRAVRPVQRQRGRRVLERRVVRRDERADDAGQHEQAEQDRAHLGL